MYRRRFLQASAAAAAGALALPQGLARAADAAPSGAPGTPAAAGGASGVGAPGGATAPGAGGTPEAARHLKRLGAAQAFDYASLKGLARAMAGRPYQPVPSVLPPAIANLTWDQWEAISYRSSYGLWAADGLRFRVHFFHLGYTVKTPVRIYVVEHGQAQRLAYDPAMFDYARSGVDASQLPADLGFAGFQLFFHTDWIRDVAAFQGASYFRATDGDKQYGLSHRGLAIDTGMSQPEEFPDFIAYYLERPQPDSSTLALYGLLDSPSISGAYRFLIDVADTVVMDIDAALYPRRRIERLGIGPDTSMFYYDESSRHAGQDWRPAIHDSDGLQLHTGAGEWLWRPLVNPQVVRVNSFLDDGPRGFGLMQRDRNFDHYQDDGAFYNLRPSAWVEPKSSWGKGAVMLVELPGADETVDNIVAFWNPAHTPQPGEELLYGYRLYWCRWNPFAPHRAQVVATRFGLGGVVGQPRTYFSWRFVVDFAGGDFPLLTPGDRVEPVISASRGEVLITSARPLYAIQGWRAMFDLKPTDPSTEPINLRLFLALNGQPLTETWLYQYVPPPPAARRF